MKLIVLAAGKGSRLHSEKHEMPKVLRKAEGRPLIDYVLDAATFIDKSDAYIVVGYKKELIMSHLKNEYNFVTQTEQLGTGHAVKIVENNLNAYEGPILVVYGDMPLFKQETYESLVKAHIESQNACTLLTAIQDDDLAYGRVEYSHKGFEIIEEKDCSEDQLKISEYNVGVYVFDSKSLFAALDGLGNDNAQGEYYLTDVPKIMQENKWKVETYTIHNSDEIFGVNTLEDLEYVESIIRNRG